jgi:trehalose-6-phosphate synthase
LNGAIDEMNVALTANHEEAKMEMERQQRVVNDNFEEVNNWTHNIEDSLHQNRSALDDFLTKDLQKDIPTG